MLKRYRQLPKGKSDNKNNNENYLKKIIYAKLAQWGALEKK